MHAGSLRGLMRVAIAGTALALAGCAARTPPTQVTRFHLGQPIAPASVSVEPRDPAMANSLEFQAYANAVAAGLARNGFRPAPSLAQSEMVAVVDVMQGAREGAPRGPAFSLGLGGASFGRNTGVGGGVSLPNGKSRPSEIVGTELSVQLKRRSEGTVIWEGRARTEARGGTPAAAPEAMVSKLAAALFQGFPGQSGQTISVK